MKYSNLFLFLLLLALNVSADQRFETNQGLCHFAYDVNNSDNEVYFANCQNTINTYDAGDGQGRLAHGTSTVQQEYELLNYTFPIFSSFFLKGADANKQIYSDGRYTTALNTSCVMVTSNYDAGADANNETVYVTNDWNLDINFGHYDAATGVSIITYALDCRNGVAQ